MNITEYLLHFISEVHKATEASVADLTPQQFSYRPSANTNHIAFSAWHLIRTEDNIIQFVLQRQPTVWIEQGLHEAWGLPKVEQGTGMDPDRAYALAVPSPAQLIDYAHAVWPRTEAFVAAASAEEFSRVTKVQPFGEIPVVQAIGQTIITHGNQHVGEIWLTREQQGLKGIGF